MLLFIDLEQWRTELVRSFSNLATGIATYIPLAIGAVAILLAGWLVAKISGIIVQWLLRSAGLDRWSSRLGVTEILNRANITSPPSLILGRVTFWVILFTFMRAAVDTLALTGASSAIQSMINYVPSLLSAGLILLLGVVMARVARNLVISASATIDLPQTLQLGAATYGLVILLSAVMALDRVGIETQILVASLTALLAAFGLAAGLAFALGARPLITHILAGHFLRQRLPEDAIVEVEGHRGMVERVGAVDTVLRDGERSISIPNARLLDETVTR